VSEAAKYLGISPNTIRKYTDRGLIKAKRLPGGDRLYRIEWLDGFVENLPNADEVA
jgi:excisionase family DNA binding protein